MSNLAAARSSVPKSGPRDRTSARPSVAAANEEASARAGAHPAEPKPSIWFRPSVLNAKLVYAGYLTSLAVPFVALIAGLFAIQNRNRPAPDWLRSHYTYQVRTFWIGLTANACAFVLSFVGIGLWFFPLIAVWVVARSVNGLILLAQRDAVADPKAYII